MKTIHTLYHLMRADFFERVRRYSFFIIAALVVYVGIAFVPSIEAGYLPVSIGETRGVYNSAWIGLIFGITLATVGILPGFYLIKVAVERDRETRVGQIIAAAQVGKIPYLLGKALSNFAVLTLLLLIMMVIAPLMQLVRAEALPVNLWDMYLPMALMYLPMAALISALAVLFESIPFLRGGFGNIAYMIFWTVFLIISFDSGVKSLDLMGVNAAIESIDAIYMAEYGYEPSGLTIGRTVIEIDSFRPLQWEGLEWTGSYILQRGLYLLLAFLPVLPAAIFFDRFDPARRKRRWWDAYRSQIKEAIGKLIGSFKKTATSSMTGEATIRAHDLSPVRLGRGRLLPVVIAELKLLVKGLPWWWYLAAAGLNIAAFTGSTENLLGGLLSVLWIWPILIWSKLGAREKVNNTAQIVFSAPQPVLRQLPAIWLAGVIFTVFTSLGAGVHLALAGESGHLLAWGVAVIFTPTLALTLSVLSGTHRLFEVVYLLLWYMALNKMTFADYMGATPEALAQGMPLIYFGLSLGLLAAAVAGRMRQVRT